MNWLISKLKNEDNFYKLMLSIALPVAFQNMISSALNTLDTLMISRLGSSSVAGVGLANQVFFFFIFVTFAINTGSSAFMAQYWGKDDWKSISKVFGLQLFSSAILGTLFMIVIMLFPTQIIRLLIKDADVVREGAIYIRTIAPVYLISAFCFAISIALRSTGNPKTPLISAIIAFFLNVFFNYVLIFGKLGFPAMGVKGAAIGTIIARLGELAVLVYVLRTSDGPLNARFKDMFSWSREFCFKYYKTLYPIMIQETFWSLSQVFYSKAFALIGMEAASSMAIAQVVMGLAFVFGRGLASACSVMIGNKIGNDDLDGAQTYAEKFICIGGVLGLLIGAIIVIFSSQIVLLFKGVGSNVAQSAARILMVNGFFFVFKTINSVLLVGVTRGGGDVKYSMKMELLIAWLVGVPLAFIGAAVLKWPVHYAFMLATIEELVKNFVFIRRVGTKQWIKNLT